MSVISREAEVAPILDRGSALTLLLVQNDKADTDVVLELLEAELPGTYVTVCQALPEALAAKGTYDVVLADLSLSGADGLDVVETLQAADPLRAVLVMTGCDDRPLALAALMRGAQDCLVKGQYDGPRLATALQHGVERHRAARPSHLARRLAHQLAESALDALEWPTCAVDADSRIVAVNRAWRSFTHAENGEPDRCGEGVDYLAVCECAGEDTPEARVGREVAAGLRGVLSGHQVAYETEYSCHSPDQQRWFSVRITSAEIDGARGAVIMHIDVTRLHRAQEEITHRALHDELTGLPNRFLLTDRLDQALNDASRRSLTTAIAFVGLDHFKGINDSLGHLAGDALLIQVAQRLQAGVRVGDTVARSAGDEFVIVWRDLTSPAETSALGERLLESLTEPFELGTSTVAVSASIGIATGSRPQPADQLLLAAEAAMDDVKNHGRGQVRLFNSALRRDTAERLTIETGLRRALERDELVLHYQPVVDLQTGRVVGAEALVRWQHPQDGLIKPDHFIPVAEASRIIVPLGRWVLEQACRDAAAWTGSLAGLDVAVNLSARQLTRPDVLDHIRQALDVTQLDPKRLLLEVTESAVMEDIDAAGVALHALADLGVRIAIDDFGTGYSSLLYLSRYPISALKIDRAFVAGIGVSVDDDAICASVVSLAAAVGATSIAEGVETASQYTALRSGGCQLAQGFLWSTPVPNLELAAAVEACNLVPVPIPEARKRQRTPLQALDARAEQRITTLHRAGASAHTIAAALNRETLRNPTGNRWHGQAIARYLTMRAREPDLPAVQAPAQLFQ